MHYEVIVKLKIEAPDRPTVLKKVVNIQRVAVQQGFQKENIQLVQVIEATSDPVVDITSEVSDALLPPTIVFSYPTDGSLVATSAVVTVQFSKNVDLSTVTNQTVILSQNGTAIPVTLQLDPTTSTVVLTPVDPLVAGKTYTVKVTQNVKSSNTVSMANPITWSFST